MPGQIKKIENVSPTPEVPIAPDKIQAPEKVVEQVGQVEKGKQYEIPSEAESTSSTQVKTPIPATVAQTSKTTADQEEIVLHKVESILSEGMEKVYLSMDASSQAIFKAKGEETSQKISNLLTHTKVQIKQVISLIVDWLRLVPNINKYYIEQEAKIKADAIMDMYRKK